MKTSRLLQALKGLYSFFAEKDLSILLILLLMVAGTWGFVAIADEFREGESYLFDVTILTFMRTAPDPSIPRGPAWLLFFMRDITALGSGTVISLVTIAVVGFMLLVRRFYYAVLMVMISGGGAALVYLLKLFFARERPVEVPPLIEVSLHSFPSGHAMMATLVYLSLAAMLAGIQTDGKVRVYIITVALLITFLIGVSRIYLGVHYPTDILAGWSIGLAWASFSRLAVLVFERAFSGRR
jgi:undecaprenyl-diphosphatase